METTTILVLIIVFSSLIFIEKMISVVLTLLFSSVNIFILMIYWQFDYLSFVYMIVYSGAVLMLFLFIIMLMDISEPEIKETNNISWGWVFIFFIVIKIYNFSNQLFIIFFENWTQINNFIIAKVSNENSASIEFFVTLFNQCSMEIISVSLILLILMIGIIKILINTHEKQVKKYKKNYYYTGRIKQ